MRQTSPEAVAASQKPHVMPVTFVEFTVDSETVRLHNGIGEIEWGGNTWFGGGEMVGVSQMKETQQVSAFGFQVLISGLNSEVANIALAKQDLFWGETVTVYLGLMNEGVLVADPDVAITGLIENFSLTEGEDAAIALACESEIGSRGPANQTLVTDATQQERFSGDTRNKYVGYVEKWSGAWGGTFADNTPRPGAGSGGGGQSYGGGGGGGTTEQRRRA